jgi:hypothetical protein
LPAALALHSYPLFHPWLFDDDFAILADSWTWDHAREHLWQPWNEHAMPLGRVSTWALVQASGRPTALPLAAAWQGPLALLAAMVLVGVFVSRELGHHLYGLVAMIVFGVTLKYNEAISWFAASFAVLALDTLLLSLLAAQAWHRTGRSFWLVWCTLGSALAPGWFASGVLTGPFCGLYLLLCEAPHSVQPRSGFRRRCLLALVPLLGTVTFLAISLPLTARHIEHAAHYAGKSAYEVFAPIAGLELTGRTLVDNLVLGVNAFGRTCPRPLVPLVLGTLAFLGWAWWRQVRTFACRRLMLLGLALVLASYWLIYSFRSAWPYEAMMAGWTRYNLVPFLGLIFFLCGGLPSREGSLFQLDTAGALTRAQAGALGLLTALLLLLQYPQGLLGHRQRDRDPAPQWAALKRIEIIDEQCRAHGIAATTARQVLSPLIIPHSGDPEPRINGWAFLRGSPAPQSLSTDDARRLLVP